MNDEELYEFLLKSGSIKQLAAKAFKKGYDKCHDEAMRYLVKEK